MKIYPSNEVLMEWEKIYIPKNDVFFISKSILKNNPTIIADTLVFERRLFFQHSEYNTLQYNNFYGYWNISRDVDYCIVTTPGWYEGLDKHLQSVLLEEQIRAKSFAVIDNDYILTNVKWASMSSGEKHEYFISIIDKLKDNVVLKAPTDLAGHLKQLANTYSVVHGSNCFGIALFMITKSKWTLNEWVYAENLITVMKQNEYKEITTPSLNGDVVIWYQDDVPFHAAVCIGHDLYLNKDNQMIWSPTKVVQLETIVNDFPGMDYKVYRRM